MIFSIASPVFSQANIHTDTLPPNTALFKLAQQYILTTATIAANALTNFTNQLILFP